MLLLLILMLNSSQMRERHACGVAVGEGVVGQGAGQERWGTGVQAEAWDARRPNIDLFKVRFRVETAVNRGF